MQHTDNLLIERLPNGVQQRFRQLGESFELELSTELCVQGALLTHAYFPITASISLMLDVDNGQPLEVGVVGIESMLGSELLLGLTPSPWRAVVRGSGTCWRIEVRRLSKAMALMPALQALLQRNLMVRVYQQQALDSVGA